MRGTEGTTTGGNVAEFRRSRTVPEIEVRRSCQENSCYRPHAHDAFSIGLIDAGTSVLASPLDGVVHLVPGDVVVIPSGQVHDCNPDRGQWLYQMTHLDHEWTNRLSPRGKADRLFSGVSVYRRADLYAQMSDLSEMVFADETQEKIESGFAALFRRLDAVAPAHRAPSESDPVLLSRLRPVIERLRTDEVNPTLAELAELVDLSPSQLERAMKRATGLAPLAWRQNARINQARQMLRDGRPIADTAHALGFVDQSHFHRVFRAHVAASPGTYRG